MAREFELPPEAASLIERVDGLEARIRASSVAFASELERVRETAKDESRRVREERAGLTGERRAMQEEFEAWKREVRLDVIAAEDRLVEERAAFDALVRRRLADFGDHLADAWAEYERLRAEALAEDLETKAHPAMSAAETVRAKGREVAQARRAAKRAEWLTAFYEQQFPWLIELRDLEEEAAFIEGDESERDDDEPKERDPASHWLSVEEWKALSTAERNQRALDRYLRSRKNPWQLGRDYERYVGYLREQDGWAVSYHGIVAGLEDLGRDLICTKGDQIEVVQCKRWAQHKTIHERHVFQLFGTVVAARIENPDMEVLGTFTTTTTLSERAHEFAGQLGIRVEESEPLADYPRIKCNIARTSKERIYHLPFDQQYDATVIEPGRGEVWAQTVAEAEDLGFRRAWRWRPQSGD